MIELDPLPTHNLARNLESLEDAIAAGELLELNRLPGGGRFAGDREGFFLAWPLQLMFHNVAWYLGYECEAAQGGNLLRFERLDRLFLGRPQARRRGLQAQQRALQRLDRLYQASAGIFLGDCAEDQRRFLSPERSERQSVEVTIELWFNDASFGFVSEGTRRFPAKQLELSPPLSKPIPARSGSVFSLAKTGDAAFPNRMRVTLPQWSIEGIDLHRWILGFGGQVKVVHPPALASKIWAMATAICRTYDSAPEAAPDRSEFS